MDDELLIKIQTLDNLFSITMKRNSTVNDLKEKINEIFNIRKIFKVIQKN